MTTERNNIGIGLDPATYNRVKKQAHKRGISMRQYIKEIAIEDSKKVAE